ncbi:MAG: hypothetical protein LBB89_04770 [Treponema sp.]|jgi:hypothetical protein|nr:hypothetical protein [Treponema sp.]
MYRKIIFVDLENVQKIDDNIISNHTKIFVMVGKGQEKLAMDLLAEKFNKVDAMELIKVNGIGQNALDFFIAFYLGKCYNELENSEIVICTKDGGYEPLKNHLLDKNINIIRISKDSNKKEKTQKKVELKSIDDIEEKFNDVCEHFDPKNKHPRPRSLKTLRQYFGKDLKKNNYSKNDTEKIIKLMIDKKIIEITDKQKEKIKWLI